jgi:ABC-2 type transport system ATP-binding protein
MSECAVKIEGLIHHYPGNIRPVLDNINLCIQPNNIFGLLGPNGAGKTTILSILTCLRTQKSGSVSINGLSFPQNSLEIRKQIGVVPQAIALYPTLTAYENLRYIGNMFGLRGKDLKNKIEEYLTTFGLQEHRRKLLQTFSEGMKRRVNLIAGMINEPAILFLDEPTVGADVQSRAVIVEQLLNLNKSGTTIIYTSHMMEEAEKLCTDIAIIDHGKILAEGKPQELISKYNSSDLEGLFIHFTGRKLRD